ncbi:MAG: DUF411 domain-containing protein [Burkholderiales bacterium]|jgi:hypothetical protein
MDAGVYIEMLMRKLIGAAALAVASVAYAAGLPEIEVWKDPNCGCCSKWISHLRASGFRVTAYNTANVANAREKLGMPHRYAACHTARVGDYIVEGHVPASDIKRLLKDQPEAIGLSVPGMPMGSPGMEGPYSEPYQTLLVDQDGNTSVFANH